MQLTLGLKQMLQSVRLVGPTASNVHSDVGNCHPENVAPLLQCILSTLPRSWKVLVQSSLDFSSSDACYWSHCHIAIVWRAVDPDTMRLWWKLIIFIFLEPECFHNIVWLILVYLFKAALLSKTHCAHSAHLENTKCYIHNKFIKNFCLCFPCCFGDRIWNLLPTLLILLYHPHAWFITFSSLLNIQLHSFLSYSKG